MKRMTCLAVVILAIGNIAFAGLSDGLVAYYPFSGNANDASGNGHHGSVQGDTTLTEDRLGVAGRAYYFDGENDYIDLGSDPAFTSSEDFTVSAWFKTSVSGDWQSIYGLSYGAGPRREYNIRVWHTDVLALKISDTFLLGTTIVTDDEWHHVAATRTGSTARIFLDGNLDAVSTSMSGQIGGRTPPLPYFIGGVHETGGNAPAAYEFHGSIDEVRIYRRVLSADEIAELIGLTIDATVNIDPDTLNLNSKGKWVTCYVELPEGYEASDIDVETVLLEGLLEVQQSDIQDGVLMVKFDREDLAAYVEVFLGVVPPAEVELVVMGNLTDGTPFEGRDTIGVIDEGGGK